MYWKQKDISPGSMGSEGDVIVQGRFIRVPTFTTLVLMDLENSNSFWGSNLVILTTSFNFTLLSFRTLYYLLPRNFEQHGANVIAIGEDLLTLVKWFQVLHHSRTTRCILTWTMREGLVTTFRLLFVSYFASWPDR